MRITAASLPDVKRIEPEVFEDERGSFCVPFNADTFEALGLPHHFVQHNLSRSRHGVLRGLHYQTEHPQGKLIHVVRGRIFDVAVDVRRGSDRFGQWTGQTLSDDETALLWVPPGFAHGFYVMSESADILYYVTDRYSPAHERTIVWDDPELGIEWPIPEGTTPVVSQKDRRGRRLAEADVYD